MDSSFLSQDVNLECSFSDLLVRPLRVSDKAVKSKEFVVTPKAVRKRWSQEETEQLEIMFNSGKRISTIASQLGRTEHSVKDRVRKLSLTRCRELTIEQENFLKSNYWLLGNDGCAKKLGRKPSSISYYARCLGLKKATKDQVNPPIPRSLLPYDMVKRVSILQRQSPTSKDKVDDAVVIFYDKSGPAAPMMAMHLGELCEALDNHFGRRQGVMSGALMCGYKAD